MSPDKDFRSINGNLFSDLSDAKEVSIAKAQKLLKEGLREIGKTKKQFNKEFSMLTWDDEGKKLAQMVQQSWKDNLGLTLKITPLTIKVVIDRMFKGDYVLLSIGYGSSYVDALSYLEMHVTSFQPKTAFWTNKKFDKFIEQSNKTTGNERIKHLAEAEKLFVDEMPIIPIYNRALNTLDKPNVKGIVRPYPLASPVYQYAYRI